MPKLGILNGRRRSITLISCSGIGRCLVNIRCLEILFILLEIVNLRFTRCTLVVVHH